MTAPLSTHLYGLLPHPSLPALLVIASTNGPRLPQVRLAGSLDPSQVDLIQAGLGPVCSLLFNVLHCLAYDDGSQDNDAAGLFLLEARQTSFLTGSLPEGAQWLDLKTLQPELLLPSTLQNGLSRWLADYAASTSTNAQDQHHSLPAPWALPGWYAQAEAWIEAELDCLGQKVLKIEPLKSWSISVVMRVLTNARPVFFKASRRLPLFVNEGVVMSALSQLYPGRVPVPLAVDAERGWLLLEDFGKPLGRSATFKQQVQLFQSMAHLQVDSAGRIDQLLRLGCKDRRIPWLDAHLDSLMDDELPLSNLTPAERQALKHALPHLHALLAELDALPVPPTLVHGDLHTGNAALQDGQILIFDWTDAAISHPFFDLFDIFSIKDPVQRSTLETAYRSVWEKIYPASAIGQALELARVVFGLYHAVSYQYILNSIDEMDREELNTAHFFLRQVLAGLG